MSCYISGTSCFVREVDAKAPVFRDGARCAINLNFVYKSADWCLLSKPS
jgi:hypothetical protein